MKLTILGRKIPVLYSSQKLLTAMAGEESIGYWDGEVIYLLEGMDKDKEKRILMHEAVHAVLNISGLTNLLDEKLEEAICDALEGLNANISF